MSECCTSRRAFLTTGIAAPALAGFAPAPLFSKDPERQPPVRKPLRVLPVLTYELAARREATSWRAWGGIMTEADVAPEKERIGRELAELRRTAEFPLDILPLATAQTRDQAAALAAGAQDATLVYAAGGGTRMMELLTPASKWNLMFLRHSSGPAYLWYEIVHPRLLRKTVDQYGHAGLTVRDVVTDKPVELVWRMRALAALKNTLGKRIVAVGGPSGWGEGGRKAPQLAREVWKLDLQTVDYSVLGDHIKAARQNDALVKRAHAAANAYMSQKGVKVETKREFILNAFVLTEVLRGLLDAADTDALTINDCMSTIMPMSETTACLPLSLLNDEGYMAFCESDFVVIPSGILLRYISGTPVFLNDPTFPHDGLVTIAHCTAPRRMDGQHVEPVRILTHFESDYGAAPKVEFRKGQRTTNIVPDFDLKRWVGFEGDVIESPFLAICRSQAEISVRDTEKLAEEMRGFHWMMGYGSYLRETGYALGKLGVEWTTV